MGIKANVEERLENLGLVVMWTRDLAANEKNSVSQRELIARVMAEEIAGC